MVSLIGSKTIILPWNFQTAKGLFDISPGVAGECEVNPGVDAARQTGQQERNGKEQSCKKKSEKNSYVIQKVNIHLDIVDWNFVCGVVSYLWELDLNPTRGTL